MAIICQEKISLLPSALLTYTTESFTFDIHVGAICDTDRVFYVCLHLMSNYWSSSYWAAEIWTYELIRRFLFSALP